jgi:tetratricopeptide (TPR) repeat protein
VLTEEALIVLAALGALGLVVLGTLELLWPSLPKHPVRRSSPPTSPETLLAERAVVGRRWRSSYPRHAASARERYLKHPKPAEAKPAASAPEPVTLASLAPPAPPVEPAAQPPSVAIVDRCFALYQDRRHTDVVALATAALATDAPAGHRPVDAREAAALWSIVALAQQALGDHAAARVALERAVETAPDAERVTYRRQLATLALGAARDLVAAAGAHAAPESERRVSDLRDALGWLDRGRVVAPNDAELRELAVTAQTRLWPAYEQVVMALVQRQEFHAARRLLREALEDEHLPAARAESFRELFSGTFSGEIGQLTAQAIRSMQEARETEALGALERAEHLLESVHDEALPPKRREEVDRRLWWGYNKLGLRRVEAGAFEEAIEPLVRALRLAAAAPDRQSDTRAALVRAFEGWTDACALAIRELADAGDREAAVVRSDKLWTRLRAALAEGLSEGELAGAFARVRRLFEEIGRQR